MKKLLIFALSAVFVVSPTFAGGAKESVEEGPVVINYYEWDVPNQQFVDDFMAEHPDIKVEVHTIPANGDRATKLDIMAMSGSDIDVMPIADGDQFIRFEQGMLAPLDNLLNVMD